MLSSDLTGVAKIEIQLDVLFVTCPSCQSFIMAVVDELKTSKNIDLIITPKYDDTIKTMEDIRDNNFSLPTQPPQ